MKKIQDLTVSDFPDIDPERFEGWKAAQLSTARAAKLGLLIVWPGIIFIIANHLFPIEPVTRAVIDGTVFVASIVGWIMYMFLRVRPLSKAARALARDAGIEGAALRRALRGQ